MDSHHNECMEKKQERSVDGNRRLEENARKIMIDAERTLIDSLEPVRLPGLKGFQRKIVHQHFEKTQEYEVKTYRDASEIVMKVYPVGNLKRLAEQKTQEVLMQGHAEELPPMGSYERFVIHDYLKDRDGIKTQSTGQKGEDRRITIMPLFGRTPRRVKKRRL